MILALLFCIITFSLGSLLLHQILTIKLPLKNRVSSIFLIVLMYSLSFYWGYRLLT